VGFRTLPGTSPSTTSSAYLLWSSSTKSPDASAVHQATLINRPHLPQSGPGWEGGDRRLCGGAIRCAVLGVVRLGRSGTSRRASEEAGDQLPEGSCQSPAMSCQHRAADSRRDGAGLDDALRRLATYGSLAPDRPIDHQLEARQSLTPMAEWNCRP
jgi:hypothetical protein